MSFYNAYKKEDRRSYEIEDSVTEEEVAAYLETLCTRLSEEFELTGPGASSEDDIEFSAEEVVLMGVEDMSATVFFVVDDSPVLDKQSVKFTATLKDASGASGDLPYESIVDVKVHSRSGVPGSDSEFSAEEVGEALWLISDLYDSVSEVAHKVAREEFEVVGVAQQV